mgnify:CR=1 FL=1
MTFSSLWPLAFLLAIPLIIILYLWKPKGEDRAIASTLLWNRLLKMPQSRTFFEKFLHDLLMYLQIAITLMLIIALMAPQIMSRSKTGGNTVIVIDTGLSMQHKTDASKGSGGTTRLDYAKEQALAYARSCNGSVSIVTCAKDARICIAASTDQTRIRETIYGISPEDCEGSLREAYSLVVSMEPDHVLIFTDGDGLESVSDYAEHLEADVYVCGKDGSSNVSLDYMVMAQNAAGYEASLRFTNYSDYDADFEVTVYDESDRIVEMTETSLEAGKSGSVLMSGMNLTGPYAKAEISAITFHNGSSTVSEKDSLEKDNITYAVTRTAGEVKGILISSGNTFMERAYMAVTGEALPKSATDSAVAAGDYSIVVYDAGFRRSLKEQLDRPSLEFAPDAEAGVLNNVVITAGACELTKGIENFQIGANSVRYYDLPEGAVSFMEADGKCVGYYGVIGGQKRIVVGFDIRETNFPVMAEFPIFIAESITYLSDRNALAENVYEAGVPMVFNPSVTENITVPESRTNRAGIFYVSIEDKDAAAAPSEDGTFSEGVRREYYVVRPSAEGRDGRETGEDIINTGSLNTVRVNKSLRGAFLVLALLLLILEWFVFVKKKNYKRPFYLIVHIILLLLVILAIVGIRIPRVSRKVTTIFVMDLSVSNEENREIFEEYIDDQLEDLPKNNQYGIVTFGRDTAVEQFVTDRDMFMGIAARTDGTGTNIEAAIQRAASMIPDDSAGRIVVLTDGRETIGDVRNTSGLITQSEISLEAVVLEQESDNDAFLKDVQMPNYLHPGDSYYITVSVQSNYETDAVVELLSEDILINSENVHLQRGENTFVFEEVAGSESMESFTVHVVAEGDTCAENDSFSAYTEVEDAPKILVIKGNGDSSDAFRVLLEAAHVNADFFKAGTAAANGTLRDLNSMLSYRAIVLENVYVDNLPENFMDLIETYVRDYGRGLIVCGGEDSFMLGGYNDTPIETVLPVNMELRGTAQIPKTAIVMVIDHSGSMDMSDGHGATYLDVAVEAAKRGVDNLRETDEVGILAFDDRFTWAHHLSSVRDKDQIKDDIETIRSGGGTTIMPALEEARNALLGSDAQVRHIILLTDGYGETSDFSAVTDRINDSGITLSTVAVGMDSDTLLMERLARTCNGRYYYADSNTDIPRIFAQEVYLGGDTYIKNGDFGVVYGGAHELTDGLFTDGWSNVLGYVAASPKTGASQLLMTQSGDPLLTVWQYGLGKTVAWNSDVDGGWSASYMGNEDFAELWKRITDFASGNTSIGEDSVEVHSANEKTVITYTAAEYSDDTEISALYTRPDGSTGQVTFTAKEPGVYEAEIDSVETGLYNINVLREDDGNVSGAFSTASVVQYSEEYRFDKDNSNFVEFINLYGTLLDLKDNVWKKIMQTSMGSYDLTNWLLVFTILYFLAEIIGQRFGWEPGRRRRPTKSKKVEETGVLAGATSGQGYAPAQAADGYPATAPESAVAAETNVWQAPLQQTAGDGGKKTRGKKVQTAPAAPAEQGVLDTSALLQKKRDRNM